MQSVNMRFKNKPPSRPPFTIPQYCPFLKNSGPDYIKPCVNCVVYTWTTFGNSFWMYPVDIQGCVVFCYAWDGSEWKYIQFKINLIDCFY